MRSAEPQKYVGAVESAVKIMRRLAQTESPEGVATIARETGLNVSTTFNILKTLAKEGLVAFDDQAKSYRIGMGVMELATPILGRAPGNLIRPLMAELAERYSVLIALWNITSSDRIVLIDRVVPLNVVHADLKPGSRLPVLAGAIGRCVAAVRGYSHAALEAEFTHLRWQAPPSFAEYWADVKQAETDGFAFDFGQLFKGLGIAATAICDRDGIPRLGLSAITIEAQTEEEDLRRAALGLHETAGFIERNVFGRRP